MQDGLEDHLGIDVSVNDLEGRFPGISGDIESVCEWLNAPVHMLQLTLGDMPIEPFVAEASGLLDTYPDFPRDAARTSTISELLDAGSVPWPIFFDDDLGIVMEGRHRMVAFYLRDMRIVPVVRARCLGR